MLSYLNYNLSMKTYFQNLYFPFQRILIKNYNIKAFSMSDVHRLGIQQVMKETLEYLTIKYFWQI